LPPAAPLGLQLRAAVELTASGTHDGTRVPKLLKAHDRSVSSFTADGAYDSKPVYDAIAQYARRPGQQTMPRVLIPTVALGLGLRAA
jgi:hypothetical protein